MITPETASQALSSWLAYLQITQETATQLITRAFLEQPARPEIAVHRIERDDGTVDYDAWRRIVTGVTSPGATPAVINIRGLSRFCITSAPRCAERALSTR